MPHKDNSPLLRTVSLLDSWHPNPWPEGKLCSVLKGTWQRGGFSGVFAEIGSA